MARHQFEDQMPPGGHNASGALAYAMQRPQLGPGPISMAMGGGEMMPGMMYGMHGKPGGGIPPPGGIGGKVYPANQPMVFNPSNPNAPPIYPCSVCHKEVRTEDIQSVFIYICIYNVCTSLYIYNMQFIAVIFLIILLLLFF